MTIFPSLQLSSLVSRRREFSPLLSGLLGVVFWGATGVVLGEVRAQEPPETAPAELTTLIEGIEAAANRQDVNGVMQFYGENFSTTDGLDRRSYEQVLTQLWQNYSNLNYQTQLQSWERDGSAIVATTVTEITGTQDFNGRDFQLTSTITSEQRIENQKVVQQDVLAERNQLTSGEEPPTVTLRIPEQVKPGQEYSVDAIVEEPLGEEIMIGTAIEERVTPRAYLTEFPLELEFLPSGGVFKVGTAPKTPGNNWISAILMRPGGITLVTQRLKIVQP
ncbi:nuclear transport factor 2 family protein [Capilliphycus salinus ALCB114379]|uniref:nuclear transport factor 2 family protein n=1 Tax=Capilliphycus salinus TaxID=2768948 RepID=UPI0039A76B52